MGESKRSAKFFMYGSSHQKHEIVNHTGLETQIRTALLPDQNLRNLPRVQSKIFKSFKRKYVVTYNEKHTPGRNPLEERSARRRGLYLQNAPQTRNKHSCTRKDSNPQFQQSNSHRPIPWTARPPGTVIYSQRILQTVDYSLWHRKLNFATPLIQK